MPNSSNAKPKPPLYKGMGVSILIAGGFLLLSILLKIVIGNKHYWAESSLLGAGWGAGITLSVLISNVIARFTGMSLPVVKYQYLRGFIDIFTPSEMKHYGLKKAPFYACVISVFLCVGVSAFVGYLFVIYL